MIGHFFGPGGNGKSDGLSFRKYKVQANENASIATNVHVFQVAKEKDIVAGRSRDVAQLSLAK